MLGIHNTSLQLQRVGMLTLDIHAALSYGFLEANMDFFKKKSSSWKLSTELAELYGLCLPYD